MTTSTRLSLRIACHRCWHHGSRRTCYVRPQLSWGPIRDQPDGTRSPNLLAHCPHCFRFLRAVDPAKWGAFADNARPTADAE